MISRKNKKKKSSYLVCFVKEQKYFKKVYNEKKINKNNPFHFKIHELLQILSFLQLQFRIS